jgi:hypothetical protein
MAARTSDGIISAIIRCTGEVRQPVKSLRRLSLTERAPEASPHVIREQDQRAAIAQSTLTECRERELSRLSGVHWVAQFHRVGKHERSVGNSSQGETWIDWLGVQSRVAAIRNSLLPAGPLIGLSVTPSTRHPGSVAHQASTRAQAAA